ncbi:MAG: L-threonylcarbamoyladenylate synthase, partial [Planctomycetota bacterium]
MPPVLLDARNTNAFAADVARAAAALRGGALVIFPTETVYGVAANAALPEAVARLRAAKGRADVQPFTVHLGRRSDARRYLSAPGPLVRRLVRRAWPGPLTLVCSEPAPERTEAGGQLGPGQIPAIYHAGAVGLRCPDHPVAARLLAEADVPVVASSANRHGEPPPLEPGAALRDLGEQADFVIDAGPTRYHTASTIVEVRDNTWRVLRPGALDERTLERMATSEILFVCTGNSCRSPMAEHLFRQGLAERLNCRVAELAGMGYRVVSAGVGALRGGAASPGAREEMQRRGFDLAGHRSQPLTVELIHRAEKIFVMSPEHRRAVLDLAPAAAGRVELLDPQGPVADPFGGSDADYQQSADQIARAVQARLEEYVHEDRHW